MMARKTDTKTLLKAMRILARDIQSDDGVANGAISEAADRMEELQAERDRLREAYDLLIAWHDVVRDQVPIIPSPYGLAEMRTALQEDRDDT